MSLKGVFYHAYSLPFQFEGILNCTLLALYKHNKCMRLEIPGAVIGLLFTTLKRYRERFMIGIILFEGFTMMQEMPDFIRTEIAVF